MASARMIPLRQSEACKAHGCPARNSPSMRAQGEASIRSFSQDPQHPKHLQNEGPKAIWLISVGVSTASIENLRLLSSI